MAVTEKGFGDTCCSRGGNGPCEDYLKKYAALRAQERQEVGESFGFGPGYMSCARDYIDRADASLLLDAVSSELGLPRDRIVPVMAGSCAPGEYLAGPEGFAQVLQITDRLDIVVFESAGQAKAFRKEAPVLLPLSVTRDAIAKAADGLLSLDFVRSQEVLDDFHEERARWGIFIQYALLLDVGRVSMHLGADEGLKAVFKVLANEGRADSVHMPVPNYFDAQDFALQYGFKLRSLGSTPANLFMGASRLDPMSSPIVYLSNPNNPLGWCLDPHEINALRRVLPQRSTLVVDTTNINMLLGGMPMTTFWNSFVNDFGVRTVAVGSFSKMEDVVERRGFVYGPEDIMREVQKQQPPCLSGERSLPSFEMQNATCKHVAAFRARLNNLGRVYGDQIILSESRSNFISVFFCHLKKKEEFMRKMAELDPARADASAIVGLPLAGAGELEFNADGSVKTDTGKPGILGLREHVVRLNALNHQVVLDVLEEVLG